MDWPAFEDEVRAGHVPAEAEVRCPPITGERFVRAGDLEVWKGLVRSPEAAIRRALERRRFAWLTVAVGLVLVLAWIPSAGIEARARFVAGWGALLPAVLDQQEAWRLLTAVLVHAGPLHLAGNLVFLLWAGTWLERAWGRVDLAILLVTCAIVANTISMVASPDRASVGASGMVCGLLGAAATFGWRHRLAVPRRFQVHFGSFSLFFAALVLASGLLSAQVGLWGHLAGLGTGGLMGLVLGPGRWRRIARYGALASGAVLLAVPAVGGPRITPLSQWTADGVACEGPATWIPTHTRPGERRIRHPSGAAVVVIETATVEGEADVNAAVEVLLATVHRTSSAMEAQERTLLTVDGFPGADVVLFVPPPGSAASGPGTIYARVIARASYIHTVRLESAPGHAGRWATLWRRIRASVRLVEPDAVVEARAVARNSPGSARARERLARALEAAGTPGD